MAEVNVPFLVTKQKLEVKCKNIIIPVGKIVQNNCKPIVGLIEKQRAFIFHQRDSELIEGIHHVDSVVPLKFDIRN